MYPKICPPAAAPEEPPRAVETIVLLTPTPRNGSDARRGDPFRRLICSLVIFFLFCLFCSIPQPLSLHPGAPRFALRSGLFPLDCVVTPTPRSSPEIPKTAFPVVRSRFSRNRENLPKNLENLRKIAKFGGSGFGGLGGRDPPSPLKIPPKFWGGFPKNLKKRGAFPTQNRGFLPKSG